MLSYVLLHSGAPLRILGPLDSIFTRALLRSGGGMGGVVGVPLRTDHVLVESPSVEIAIAFPLEPASCTHYFYIYIYIYAFSRRFYPKRLTLHSSYSFFLFVFFYIWSALAFPGNRTHDLGVANTMLYHLSYRKAHSLFLRGHLEVGVGGGGLSSSCDTCEISWFSPL